MTEETDSEPKDIGWKEKLRTALEAGRSLFATRAAIFREELAEKGVLLGRGFAGLVLALIFGWLALLLLTAFIAVLLSRLLGSAVL
ncbi:MAG TPA: phage holin family protein, partial [Thermoanaerobaculia bacterium]|nr:phage holin family protein [Thermoanaerobaculia bacterium]